MPNPSGRASSERRDSVALLLITIAAALLRLSAIGAEDLWFDETFSAVLASQDLAELLRRAIVDQTNPPGFYLALWAWTRLGGFDPAWMRALSALAGIALVPSVAWLARSLRMSRAGALLAALLAATSPLLLAMSIEVRAYALLALATTLTMTAAIRATREAPTPGPFAALLLGNLALVGLHYFGLLVVIAVGAAALWVRRGSWRTVVLAALPACIALAAWGAAVAASRHAGQGTNADWIGLPGVRALTSFTSLVVGAFDASWGIAAVSLALLLAILVGARDARPSAPEPERDRARWLLTTALLPLLLLLLAMVTLRRSAWVGRYLIIVLPPCCLLLASAATRWRGAAGTAMVTALSVWAALAGPLAEAGRIQRPSWSLIVRSLAGDRSATVCVNEAFVSLPLEYHALGGGVPLEVRTFTDCAARKRGDYTLTRPGTEASLKTLRAAGALLGPSRPLYTALPDVELRALSWGAR